MPDQTLSSHSPSFIMNDIVQISVNTFQFPKGHEIMKNILPAVIAILSLFLVSTTLQANEPYVGDSLPPDEILIKNAGSVYGGRGPIVGKIASDSCHQVFFLKKLGPKLKVSIFCRLGNNKWIYSPNSDGGRSLVMK